MSSLFSPFYDALRDPVVVCDAHNHCIYVNPAFCDIFGKTPEDWTGTPVSLKTMSGGTLISHVDQSSNTGLDFSVRYTSNEEICLHWSKASLDNESTVYTGRNISAWMKHEDELQKAAQNIQAASDAKMRFLATMSHEIRTPLNGILGMAGLLLDSGLEDNQQAYTNAIQESGRALLGLINDILDFSKIDAGKLELEETTVDIRSFIYSIFELLSPRASQKGLELATYIDPSVPAKIKVDEIRLRQVLMNLVGNGIKFTAEGGVTIEVYANSPGSDDEQDITFKIRDTGIGIPEDQQQKIFDEFAQADGTTARKYEGTGLGLAISRRIVDLMGGRISLESTVGKGSIFSFTTRLEAQPAQKSVSYEQDITTPVIALTSSIILKHILSLQLEAVGAGNTFFPDTPDECMKLLEEHKNATLLCDMPFATMHGYKLAYRAGSSIVLLTQAARGRLDTFKKIGFSGYLIKPIRQSSLFERITAQVSPEKTVKAEITTATHRTLNAEERVLLAEDNRINAILAKAILHKLGYVVDHVENGREAVTMTETNNYSVILMDMRMPEMDGMDATRQIREQNNKNAGIPIIALTANATKADRSICLDAGMDDFISKPFDPDELGSLLKSWIAKRQTIPVTANAES